MATYTTNLNLKKPAYADPADIADINANMDTIDSLAGTGRTTETVKGNADDLATHMAENVIYTTGTTRDLSIAGSQTISGFPFIPKLVIFEMVVPGTTKQSRGHATKTAQRVQGVRADYNTLANISTGVIWGLDSGSNNTLTSCTINSDGTITLNWVKNGTGGTGTAHVNIIAIGHGED